MKKFLIIQLRQKDNVANSEFNAILAAGKLKSSETERLRAEQNGVPNIDLTKLSGIIVGGSPFDISIPRHKKKPIQLQIEQGFTRLFDKIVDLDFPFLGACSGNGLLGHYCGVNISNRYSESVGGVDIYVTDQGKIDPLLKGLPSPFRALVGHKEACDTTPPSAVLLASSPTCPVQMFRVKKNIYATQFHPEANAEEFELRIKAYKNYGYFDAKDAQKLIDIIAKEQIIIPSQILERFVKFHRQN